MTSKMKLTGMARRVGTYERRGYEIARFGDVLAVLILAYGVPLMGRYEMLRSPTLQVALAGVIIIALAEPPSSKRKLIGKFSARLCSAWFVLFAW